MPKLAIVNLTYDVHLPQELSRAPAGCSIPNHPHIRYRTYLVLLFNTTGEEILVLFIQSHYTWSLGLLATFCFKGFYFSPVNPISRSCCVLSFVHHVFKMSLDGGKGCTPNSLNVRISERFMSIWPSSKPRSGTDYTVSRPSPINEVVRTH